jgi:phosphoglycerol transferase
MIFQFFMLKKSFGSVPVHLVKGFIQKCIATPLILTIEMLIIEKFYNIFKNLCAEKIDSVIKSKLRIFKVVDKIIINNLQVILLFIAIIAFNAKFSLYNFVVDEIQKNIALRSSISAEKVKITANNPKNLILIYMESMEDTYKRENLFGINLLADLDNIKGVSFASYKQSHATGWTIAGIFATQCGKYIEVNFSTMEGICLSDVLAKQGYYNVFMGGTSLEFTKKGEFFHNHQYHELYGREEWQKNGVKDIYEWGAYDEDVFRGAKKWLKELHDKRDLFNLTILTGDTHAPDGYLSKYCKQKGASSLYDIVKCSAEQVADFIEFVKQNGYLDDTNIVVIGDHLFPIDTKVANIKKSKRYIFNRFISKEEPIKEREEIVHFDLFPTILDYIGLKVEGGRLGIGRSAFK